MHENNNDIIMPTKTTVILIFISFIILFIPSVIFSFKFELGPDVNNKSNKYEGMVLVPAGNFIMGSSNLEISRVEKNFGKRGDFINYNFDIERPLRKRYVKAFYIDAHEVTNKEYMRFVKLRGHPAPHHWKNGKFKQGKEDNPVIFVNWFDASSYCAWQNKRLPDDDEWEKAARGIDGRRYPWGNEFDPDKAITAEYVMKHFAGPGELTFAAVSVLEEKGDVSPYGVYGMAGNVMEWTKSSYKNEKMRIIRGASWIHLHPRARAAAKEEALPQFSSHLVGFRCAADNK